MPSGSAIYSCAGCGADLLDNESAVLWFDTPFGYSTARSCRNQDCAHAAVANKSVDGWRLRRGNRPPMSKEEKERLARDP